MCLTKLIVMKLLDTGILLEFFSGSEEEIDRIDSLFRLSGYIQRPS